MCVLVFQNCIFKIKTKATQNLPSYLEHLTHLALHAGVVLCSSVQMPFFEIKDSSLLAWCQATSFLLVT